MHHADPMTRAAPTLASAAVALRRPSSGSVARGRTERTAARERGSVGDPVDQTEQRRGHPSVVGPFSILFDRGQDGAAVATAERPDSFPDLHLDEIVRSITRGRDGYDLEPFFWVPLRDTRAVRYRHEVFQDLESADLAAVVRTFAAGMRTMRERLLAETKAYYLHEKERWFLDAAAAYGEAVLALRDELGQLELRSAGFVGLRAYLDRYVPSEGFAGFLADASRVTSALDGVTYRLDIDGARITVSPYDGEPDYGAEVLWTFERFKQRGVKGPAFTFRSTATLNHVEASILERVARVCPTVFSALDEFRVTHRSYLDETIARFDREVQFYLAYREHMARFAAEGLSFCYPRVSVRSKDTLATDTFDLALADVLLGEGQPIVTNDLHLDDPERILVVSGPNQGGKTTFARTVGQIHYLAGIGVPVPGTEARLFLVDRIFTHFDRVEQLEELTGKLEDDLRRIHRILQLATPASLVILNESFGSTTVRDALFLNRHVMRALVERDLLCVTVTFLDEVATYSPTTVSMVSTVDPLDPARRTFKIVRKPADGLAYALAIAEKHRVTHDLVKRRLQR